jgi:hypothetical protein
MLADVKAVKAVSTPLFRLWPKLGTPKMVNERESVAIGKEIKGKEKNMEVLVQE